MRKNRLITLLSSLTLVVAGIGAIAAVFKNNSPRVVNAENSTVYLHATSVWDKDEAWFAIYGYHYSDYIPTENKSVIYFVNTGNWSTVKIHAWDGEFSTGEWASGPSMSKVTNFKYDNHDVYYYNTNKTIDLNGNQKIIFHNGSGTQTANISINDKKTLCFNKDGGFKELEGKGYGTKTENWSKMEKVDYSGSDTSYYSGTYTKGDVLIFVRKNPADQSLTWDNVWGQTYDLNGIPEGKNCYQIDYYGQYAEKPTGSWHNFNPNGDDKEYAVGNFAVKNPWSVESGVKMKKNNDTELKVTLPLKAKDELRFYVNNYQDAHYDDNYKIVIKSDSPVKATISNNNIVMPDGLEEGAYTLYWSYADSNWGVYIAKETDTARSLELYINQYDTEGQCTTKFYNARTRYLAMSSEEQNEFMKTEASYRYEAWAISLGENPWGNSKISSNKFFNYFFECTDSAIWIIVAVAFIGISATGAFFFYKKRKEN